MVETNETELATACSLLKLGNRYIEFTIPLSILFAGLKSSHNKKLKTKTLFLISAIFSLISTSQSRFLAPIWVYPQPSKFYAAAFPRLQFRVGEGRVLRMFLPLASPLHSSQPEFISLLFSGILGTSILSLTTACPVSQLVRSLFIPEMESFTEELSCHLLP